MLTAPRAPDPPMLLATRYRTPVFRGTTGGSKGSLGGGESSSVSAKTSKFITETPPAGEAATMTAENITAELGDGSTSPRVLTDDRDDGNNFSAGEPPQATAAMPPSSGSSSPLRGRQEQGKEATSRHGHTERRRSSIGSNRDNTASAPTITGEETLRPPIASAEKRDGEGRETITAAIAPASAFRREEAGGGGGRMESERVHIDPHRKEQLQQALALAKQRTGVKRAGSSSLGALDFHGGGEGGGRGGCESRGRSRGRSRRRDRGHGVHDHKVIFLGIPRTGSMDYCIFQPRS